MEEKNREYAFEGKVSGGFAMLAFTFIVIPLIMVLLFCIMPDSLFIIPVFGCVVCIISMIVLSCGFFILQPNQAYVMIFFGEYRGTFRNTGFYWANPFLTKKKISLRIRNMDAPPIKVNDKVGNPVMIGMVLVWKVKDTYRAVFDVDAGDISSMSLSEKGQIQLGGDKVAKALDAFVAIQSDAALREVTGRYAYDEEDGKHDEITLRSDGHEVNEELELKLNERLAMAGIEVVEARLNYLAYAPEIAAVMLRRQQASAIISAREKIVEGAVSMVKMALDQLKEENVVELDEERKATMVSNLLVVLCADEPAQPVLNTGTLYQ